MRDREGEVTYEAWIWSVVAAAGKRVSAVFQQMFKIRLGERRVQLGPETEHRKTDSFKDKPAANASEVFISDPGQKEG